MAAKTNTITWSKERELSSSEIRYRRLLETAEDGVLILDAVTRRITDANLFMVELLGYSRHELLEKELWEIGLLKDAKATRQAFRELREQGYIRYDDLALQSKDGKQRKVECLGTFYVENGHQFIQCNIRDITERKLVELRLRKANDELTAVVSELERRDAEAVSLNRMYKLLQGCTTQVEVYNVVPLVAVELFSGYSGCLAILRSSDRSLEPVASWGTEALVKTAFSMEECWALRRDQVHHVTDPQVGSLCCHFAHLSHRRCLCLPLTVQSQTLGVLCVTDTSASSTEQQIQHRRLAVTVVEAITTSLASLRLQEKLRDQAIRDPLTGLFNRRVLEETLAHDVSCAQRRNSPLCVVMLDIDDFKRFNDTLGHEAGDSVLRELGRRMRQILRQSDISCRYGGDEFVLVLPDSLLADTRKRVEQVCAGVKELPSLHNLARPCEISASAGIAQSGPNASDPSELLRAADKALYAAKAAGGSRVGVYREEGIIDVIKFGETSAVEINKRRLRLRKMS